jgi:hypothetical protein
LLLREPGGAAPEQFGRFGLFQPQAAGVARVNILEPESFALSDTERGNVFFENVNDFFSRHGVASTF